MTNREYMSTLSDLELARYISDELPIIWRQYNSSESGLALWFAEERREDAT